MKKEEYQKRYFELRAKFSDKFIEDKKTSNVNDKIFEALVHGVDPYIIIENLCEMVTGIQKEFEEHLKWSTPKPIIIPKEQYETFIKSQER